MKHKEPKRAPRPSGAIHTTAEKLQAHGDQLAEIYRQGFIAGLQAAMVVQPTQERAPKARTPGVPQDLYFPIADAPLDGTPVIIDANNGPTLCRYTTIPERPNEPQWWVVDEDGRLGPGAIAYPSRWRPAASRRQMALTPPPSWVSTQPIQSPSGRSMAANQMP